MNEMMESGASRRSGRVRHPRLLPLPAVIVFLFTLVPAHSLNGDRQAEARRTIRLKVALDEEFRRRADLVFEVKKTVAASSRFFEKHFGLSLKIEEIVHWHSDNTRWTLEDLCDDLYNAVERGDSDVVVGFTRQIRGDARVNGVASYEQGYVLINRFVGSYLSRVIFVHELCHVFGAVDLEMETSIMNKDSPQLECDDFTGQVVRLHRHRRFGSGIFPLTPDGQDSAITLYEQRKGLRRREAGLCLRLAALYLEKRESEKAIRECLDAERIAPGDPAIRTFLELAYRQKEELGPKGRPSPIP
jgi:hypothetical protein